MIPQNDAFLMHLHSNMAMLGIYIKKKDTKTVMSQLKPQAVPTVQMYVSSWWFQPKKNMPLKIGSFGGKNQNIWKTTS